MKFISLCKKIINVDIKSFVVKTAKKEYFRHSIAKGQYKYTYRYRDFEFEISYNSQEELSEFQINILNELFESYSDFSEIKIFEDKWNCSEMLKSVLENKPIEDIMYEMIKVLTENDHFKKIGILFLNERLMRLKGVMFGEVNEKFRIENLEFKSVSIYLNEKSNLTDVLFYDIPKIISIDQLKYNKLDNFFTGDVIVAGLYSSTAPIGVIMAENSNYRNYNIRYLSLFARICSIAIELTKTLKRLDFAIQDINYFKESLYATDSLARIGRLSATVAHELKNPLVAIGGFVNRLNKIVEGEREKNYLNIISSEVYRLENIVTEILNYSKTLNVTKKKLLLNKLLDEIFELLNDKIQYYQIDCHKNIDENFEIFADEIRIKQVLINVIDNAVHAMEDGGRLDITAESDNNNTVVYIQDSGEGISDDMKKKIFEPFFTTKSSGTGLGLPLSKKIMLAHKGDIKVENYGNGVLVSIVLPNDVTQK